MGNLDDSLGVIFVTAMVGAALWGISCAQVFHYAVSPANDGPVIETAVAVAMCCDTAQLVIVTLGLYQYAVTEFGDLSALQYLPKFSAPELALIALATFIVQTFYSWRIYRMCKQNWWILVPLILLILAELATITVETVFTARSKTWGELARVQGSGSMPVVCFSLLFATDTVIAILMCWILSTNRTEYVETNSIISKLIVFIISSNAVTSLCALGVIVGHIARPNTIIHTAFSRNIIRLEVNCFMAALNMRPYLARTPPSSMPSHSLLRFRTRLAHEQGSQDITEWPEHVVTPDTAAGRRASKARGDPDI